MRNKKNSDVFIRSLISTKVDSDSAITVIQDVNDLIDDDPIKNLLEPNRGGANVDVKAEVSNIRQQFIIDRRKTAISKVLQEMCKQGYLLSDSKGRWTTYHLNTNYLDSVNNEESVNYDFSNNNVDTSGNNRDTSDNNVDTSENNRDTSPPFEKRSYIRKDELENMILSICNSDFKTLEELAVGIAKNPKYVKNSIIPKLIESGKLERLYPKIINHPHQAYKAKE